MDKLEVKKVKAKKTDKDKSYELPEIPDYERPVLEKPREFDFGEHKARDKTQLERPATQVRPFIRPNISLSVVNKSHDKSNLCLLFMRRCCGSSSSSFGLLVHRDSARARWCIIKPRDL